jgi:hypothetical protein
MEIDLREPLSPLIGQYSDRALLVCGSGRCLWDDLARIKPELYDIMAINDCGLFLPYPVTHWFSGYTEDLQHWIPLRRTASSARLNDRRQKEPLITHARRPGASHIWQWAEMGQGTSTLDGVIIGVLMGYSHVIVAGTPLDYSGHFFDPPGERPHMDHLYWEGVTKNWEYWKTKEGVLDNVRSLSGNTKRILGDVAHALDPAAV